MGRYFLSLAMIAALMAAVFYGLRKARFALGGHGQSTETLRVLNRVSLDQRNSLFAVRADNELLIVATGPQGTQLLTKRAVEAGEDSEHDAAKEATASDADSAAASSDAMTRPPNHGRPLR